MRWWKGVRLLALVCLLACTRSTEFIGSSPVWNCGARCFRDENPPSPPQPLFTGSPDPVAANKPQLVYPLAGSVHPRNLAAPTVQWRSGTAMLGYYRLRVTPARAPQQRYDFYIPCRAPPIARAPDQCQYPLPARAWALMAADSGDGDVTVTVTSTRAEAGVNYVVDSEPVTFAFAAPVEAGLYYFSPGRNLQRAPLGAATSQPFAVPSTRFACAGCHAVSRDGRVTAYVYDRQYLGAGPGDDPAKPTIAPAEPPVPDAASVALSPDGRLVAVSQGGQLSIRDIDGRAVGAPIAGLYFPDWSPDGRAIAATQATTAEDSSRVNDGAIVVVSWDGTQLGAPRTVVAGDTELHFHPAWSPDGAWLAFASAPRPGTSYDNAQARLRLVPSVGGTPVDLGRAGPGSWPRFVPVSQADGKVFYLGFDSRRDGYLWRDPAGPTTLPQLWLTALDLRRLPGDPSSPPLWLPFQNPGVANILGAWTERIACGPQSPCGSGTRCEDGRCLPLPP